MHTSPSTRITRALLLGALLATVTVGGARPSEAQPDVTAQAAPVVVGGGMSIGRDIQGFGFLLPDWCTLTAVGHDRAGRLVGLIAGHCAHGNRSNRVFDGNNRAAGPIGHFAHYVFDPNNVATTLDYGVIVFDPAKVAPTSSFGGFAINGVAPAPADGSFECKKGATTGVTCGLQVSHDALNVTNTAFALGGDSGGPLTLGDQLVGMVHGPAGGVPVLNPTAFRSVAVQLADLDAKNVPGSGFRLLAG